MNTAAKPQPLDQASKILTPVNLREILQCRQVNYQGWKILDLMALAEPARLMELQTQGITILLMEILDLQETQTDLLTSPEAIRLRQQGLAEVDIIKSLTS